MRDRHPEHGHDGVADELPDDAAVRFHDAVHPFEVAGQQRPERLRIVRLAESGRAGDVAEEDGDGPALLAGCCRLGQLGTAVGAEREVALAPLPAVRADDHVARLDRRLVNGNALPRRCFTACVERGREQRSARCPGGGRHTRRRPGDRGRAGPRRLFVYATGRSSRVSGRSEIGRPETIEETGDLIGAAGGTGAALVVDHEDPAAVAELVGAHRARARPSRRAGQRHLRRRPVRGVGQAAVGARLARRAADAPDGRGHPPHHLHAAIPLILRTATAGGTTGWSSR